MSDGELLLKKRLVELSDRSAARGVYESTEFLSLADRSVLHALERSGAVSPAALFGGTERAERVIAVFGNEADCGYAYEPELRVISIAPLSEKFGEELSHRDVLGAVMSLGVRRELTGDIYTRGKHAFLVALDTVAPYIAANLVSVKHTDVRCELLEKMPEGIGAQIREECFISASERLDCILSAVYNVSRSAAKELFDKERVFVNGSLRAGASAAVGAGDVVSVRGKGKFVFLGPRGETRKGRLKFAVGIYE
ncbi:MAG: hypothetical protein IJL26_08960 [Clostridia bacterium]|nr:hypothetical protein [Clostridia bacterium]